MKLSVCGKGGSGKSTVATLLSTEARSRGYRVLVVDSDESNSGLFRILGFDQLPIPLMELVGGKKKVIKTMTRGFSSDNSEKAMTVLMQDTIGIDDIPAEYIQKRDNLSLVCIGKILQSLEGCACPMGVLSREFLKKLSLKENELAIVDMEAGVEHFGRGVETSIDSVLIVVEPPFESVEVAERIHRLAAGIGIENVWAVLSKIPSDEIATKLREKLDERGIDVIGCLHFDPEVFESSMEGRALGRGRAAEEMGEVFDNILSQARSQADLSAQVSPKGDVQRRL
jgi:CO dehydrogenase maturation factor